MSKLFLDDCRPAPTGWHIVRSYAEFASYLDERGCPEVVSFDHDLAPEHYDAFNSGSEKFGGPPTGLDCAKLMIERGFIPKRVIVHSWNPPGAQRIADLFAGKTEVVILAYGVPEHLARVVEGA